MKKRDGDESRNEKEKERERREWEMRAHSRLGAWKRAVGEVTGWWRGCAEVLVLPRDERYRGDRRGMSEERSRGMERDERWGWKGPREIDQERERAGEVAKGGEGRISRGREEDGVIEEEQHERGTR